MPLSWEPTGVPWGIQVTRKEQMIVRAQWIDWASDKTMSNQACIDFYFEIVRADARVRHVNIFEVLDLVVNTDLRQIA